MAHQLLRAFDREFSDPVPLELIAHEHQNRLYFCPQKLLELVGLPPGLLDHLVLASALLYNPFGVAITLPL